jgi:hypothetical protein
VEEVVEFGGSGVGYRRSTVGMIDLVRIEGFVEETEDVVVGRRVVAGVHMEKRAVEEQVPYCSTSRDRGGLALAEEGSFDPLQDRKLELKLRLDG